MGKHVIKEDDRRADQVSRAQKNMQLLLTETEDEDFRLRGVASQQHSHRRTEKATGRIRRLGLPCAFVRIAVPPRPLKQKGKILPTPFPTEEEVLEKARAGIAGALRNFGI